MIKIAIRPNPHCDGDARIYGRPWREAARVFLTFSADYVNHWVMKHVVWIPLLLALSAAAAISQTTSPTTPQMRPLSRVRPQIRPQIRQQWRPQPSPFPRPCRHGAEQPGPRPHRVLQSRPAPSPGRRRTPSALGAVALYAEGNPSAAVHELEQAHSTADPNDLIATLNLAISYSQLGALLSNHFRFSAARDSSVRFPRATSTACARTLRRHR